MTRLAAVPVVLATTGFPIRACNLMPSRTPGVSEDLAPSKTEPAPARVTVGSNAPRPPLKPATFPEAVVVRALDAVQGSLMRCYLRALQDDPTLGSQKVVLHLEVSEYGMVTAARADSVDAKLAMCVGIVARGMTFPASGTAAKLDVPLFFRR